MSTNLWRGAAGIAILILIFGAYYAGKASHQANAPLNQSETSSINVVTTASTTATSSPAKLAQSKQTQSATVSRTHSYTPVLTRVSVTSRGNTTILRCTGVQAIATGFDQNGAIFSPLHVTWSSSDPNIAVIDQNGVAISSHVGRVILTARSGAISGSMTISVIDSIRPGAGLSPCPGPRR